MLVMLGLKLLPTAWCNSYHTFLFHTWLANELEDSLAWFYYPSPRHISPQNRPAWLSPELSKQHCSLLQNGSGIPLKKCLVCSCQQKGLVCIHIITGAIDCTSHFRTQVHPKQANYYCYDKHGFFITIQVLTDLSGRMRSVCFGLGHNNDQGMLSIMQMKEFLEWHDIKVLGDGGYQYYLIVSPDNQSTQWNNMQKALKTAQGMTGHWSFASTKVHINPELQTFCLMIIYYFVAMILEEYPLRTTFIE